MVLSMILHNCELIIQIILMYIDNSQNLFINSTKLNKDS